MNPTMAVTFTMEKRNSASPYPLIPNRLMMMIARRKMVMKMDLLRSLFQYWTVNAPAIISSGSVNSHWRA